LAQCREERARSLNGLSPESDDMVFDGTDMLVPGFAQRRALWRSPRALAAIAAGAVIGTMVWRGVSSTPAAPLVSAAPVRAPQPTRAQVQYVSPALLQAMATGNPVWPATVIIEEAPSGLVNSGIVNVDYSMSLDGR